MQPLVTLERTSSALAKIASGGCQDGEDTWLSVPPLGRTAIGDGRTSGTCVWPYRYCSSGGRSERTWSTSRHVRPCRRSRCINSHAFKVSAAGPRRRVLLGCAACSSSRRRRSLIQATASPGVSNFGVLQFGSTMPREPCPEEMTSSLAAGFLLRIAPRYLNRHDRRLGALLRAGADDTPAPFQAGLWRATHSLAYTSV